MIRAQETSRDRLSEAARANAELSAQLAEATKSEAVDEELESEDPELAQANDKLSEELNAIKRKTHQLEKVCDTQAKTIAELREEIESTPKNKKEGTKAVRDAKRLSKKVESQQKQIERRDDRLQDLASELARLRNETGELTDELAEQKAIVRAMKGVSGEEGTPDQNGRTASRRRKTKAKAATEKKATKKKSSTTKRATKKPSKSSPAKAGSHSQLGAVYSTKPSQVDDLKQISGIGPALEKRLNQVGIYQFQQVKSWSKAAIDFLDEELALGGRIRRDKWVAQAKKLSK